MLKFYIITCLVNSILTTILGIIISIKQIKNPKTEEELSKEKASFIKKIDTPINNMCIPELVTFAKKIADIKYRSPLLEIAIKYLIDIIPIIHLVGFVTHIEVIFELITGRYKDDIR